jgi:2-iminobutanoate/2-iminopropanoate deaminase
MAKRQVLKLPSIEPLQRPVPAAVRVGNMVDGTHVLGRDPATGQFPADPQQEFDQLFRNLESYLQQAGGSLDNLALVTLFLADMRYREQLNVTWLRLFPDAETRPARNTVQRQLDDDAVAYCEFTAVLGV